MSSADLVPLLERASATILTSEVPFKPQIRAQAGRMVIWDSAVDQLFQLTIATDDLRVLRPTIIFEPPRKTAVSFARAAARSTGSLTYRKLQDGRVEVACASPYALDAAMADPDALARWVVRTLEGFHGALEAVMPAARIHAPTADRGPTPELGGGEMNGSAGDAPPGAPDVAETAQLAWPVHPVPTPVVPLPAGESASSADSRPHSQQRDPIGDLDAILDLATIVGREPDLRPGFRADLLGRLSGLVPANTRPKERFGESLLRAGLLADAEDVLQSIHRDDLTPVGAAVLLETTLRMRHQPGREEVTIPIDWTVGSVVDQLLESQQWMPVEHQLRLTEVMCDLTRITSRPPRIHDWLESLGAKAPMKDLPGVLRAAVAVDEEFATERLLDWTARRNLDPGLPWVSEHLELYGLESGDDRVARKSFERLVDVVRRRNDVDRVHRLWRWADGRWGSNAAPMGEALVEAAMTHPRSSPELEQLGAILTVVIGYQLAQSGEPSEAARALANSLMTRDSTLNQDLRALVGPRDSPTTLNDEPAAITTVLDAVLLARARFAGLLVLESAIDSAKKRGSLQARKTWEVLQALGEIAERYQADPDLDVDASLRTINGYRGDVSDTAKQKYPADYRRQLPDGREIVLGPHAPTGPGGRVYLAIDRDRRQIVIGHVGEHLRGKDRV